jgi:tRNA uridine 5-carboxymethylaminomethyl modification enzyme
MESFTIETDIKYEGYLRRQRSEVERARLSEHRALPAGLRYEEIPGLSREVRQRLAEVEPETLGQAARVPGMTPAAVAILARHLGHGGPAPAMAER